jgi:hypothetical protein
MIHLMVLVSFWLINPAFADMAPQVVSTPAETATQAVTATPSPIVTPSNAVARPAGTPIVYGNPAAAVPTGGGANAAGMINAVMSALAGAGNSEPPANTDWSKYSYPDDHVFSYGGVGAGNIGNGLCTSNNTGRTQVKNGYCQMLSQILNTEGTCANRAMTQIIRAAGPDGTGVGDLPRFCSTYSRLGGTTQKSMMFEQLLASLITMESGWNAKATEKAWGNHQGKGLFQIGVSDRDKDPDCAGLNDSSIYDPMTNMKCGACIALTNLEKDMTIGHGTGDNGARGMARYFGPLRDMQSAKRTSMANAVNQYCVANTGGGGSTAVVAAGETIK